MPTQKPVVPTSDSNEHLNRLLLSASVEPWYRALLDNLLDLVHPPTEQPLQVTSKPVPVKNIWGDYRFGTQAGISSVLVHTAAITLLFTVATSETVREAAKRTVSLVAPVDIADYLPKLTSSHDAANGGGGGGGDRSILPASRGRAPKASMRQFTPPVAVSNNLNPKLAIEPTLILPSDVSLPTVSVLQYGDPLAPAGPPSSGTGYGGGIGTGGGGGIGPGQGPGLGPGSGGLMGGGTARLGGGLKAAVAIYTVEPEYSEQARKAKFQGMVVLQVVIDENGCPKDIQVNRSLGLGLDENAVEAVRKWRFRPAQRDGTPVPVRALVEVRFRLL